MFINWLIKISVYQKMAKNLINNDAALSKITQIMNLTLKDKSFTN